MLILLVSDESGLSELRVEGRGKLKIESTVDVEDALGIVKEDGFDLVVLDYRSALLKDVEIFEMMEEIGKSSFCMFLVDSKAGNRSEFLNQILHRPKMLEGLRRSDKDLLAKEGEILSDKLLESAFSEVWRMGDYVMKIRRGSIEKAEMRIRYQLDLRKNLDFLPEYYGTILGKIGDKEVLASFYEYVKPIEMSELSLSDLREILKMVEKAYVKDYYGIDLKFSNFGKKNGEIYYLDEKGIGVYVPPDWMEFLTKEWGKRIDEIIEDLKEQ